MTIFSKTFSDLFSNLGLVIPFLLQGVAVGIIGLIFIFVFGIHNLFWQLIQAGDNTFVWREIIIGNLTTNLG